MIQVALVDDHIITRKGIKTILELNNHIKIILEASNGKELVQGLGIGTELPQIVMLDINMPEMDGFATLEWLQKTHHTIKVIVFSLIAEEDTVINMITSGASGYISKTIDPSLLAGAIMDVHNHGFYLGDMVKKEYFRKGDAKKIKKGFHGKHFLCPKEVDFIRLASSNLNYKEISARMEVSPKTIENYRDSLFHKLEIKNRAALALYAYKNGLVNSFIQK